jgi:hypothetical protein
MSQTPYLNLVQWSEIFTNPKIAHVYEMVQKNGKFVKHSPLTVSL